MRTESDECQNIEFNPEELRVIEQVQEIVNRSDRFEEDERPNVLEVVKHSRCMVEQWRERGESNISPGYTNNLFRHLSIILGWQDVVPNEKAASDKKKRSL